MSDTSKRLKFFIWCSVVLCTMSAWLYVWKTKNEPEAERTTFKVAQRQILGNANTYRQGWMINKQPESEMINNILVNFTPTGWPITLKNGQADCNRWLSLLWPDGKVFGLGYSVYKREESTNMVHCEYRFPHGQQIHLQLQNSTLHVDIKKVER